MFSLHSPPPVVASAKAARGSVFSWNDVAANLQQLGEARSEQLETFAGRCQRRWKRYKKSLSQRGSAALCVRGATETQAAEIEELFRVITGSTVPSAAADGVERTREQGPSAPSASEGRRAGAAVVGREPPPAVPTAAAPLLGQCASVPSSSGPRMHCVSDRCDGCQCAQIAGGNGTSSFDSAR